MQVSPRKEAINRLRLMLPVFPASDPIRWANWRSLPPPIDQHEGDPFRIAGIASLEAVTAMSIDNLNWLSEWYLAQCNGDWEHSEGIKIDTIDNPGWWIKINLTGTSMEGRAFERMERGHPSNDLEEWQLTGSWWVAQVKDDIFDIACGPLDLAAALGVFRRWVQTSS